MKEFIKKYGIYILALILFILGTFYYTRADAYDHFAYDNEGNIYFFQHPLALKHMDLYYQMQDIDMGRCLALFLSDCKTNAQKVRFYKENAERCFEDAKKRSWLLPNLTHRDKARYCYTSIGVLLSPGDPKSKLIIALVTTLIQYGIDCNDEWDYINDKLYWSRYHYEMMEFHQNLIKNGYP